MYSCLICIATHGLKSLHLTDPMYIFTGWTNGVRNLKAEFIDSENYTIKLSWEPPDYDGGVPVYYYKLILYYYSYGARYA